MNESEKSIDADVWEELENVKALRDKQKKELGLTDEDVVDIEMQIVKEKEEEDEKLKAVREKLDETEYTPRHTL